MSYFLCKSLIVLGPASSQPYLPCTSTYLTLIWSLVFWMHVYYNRIPVVFTRSFWLNYRLSVVTTKVSFDDIACCIVQLVLSSRLKWERWYINCSLLSVNWFSSEDNYIFWMDLIGESACSSHPINMNRCVVLKIRWHNTSDKKLRTCTFTHVTFMNIHVVMAQLQFRMLGCS